MFRMYKGVFFTANKYPTWKSPLTKGKTDLVSGIKSWTFGSRARRCVLTRPTTWQLEIFNFVLFCRTRAFFHLSRREQWKWLHSKRNLFPWSFDVCNNTRLCPSGTLSRGFFRHSHCFWSFSKKDHSTLRARSYRNAILQFCSERGGNYIGFWPSAEIEFTFSKT